MAEATSRVAGEDWRDRVLGNPDMILDDRDLMRALMIAGERQMGGNIVDMRGLAMERLETRLERLEDTHRSVIAAAYENLAGTNQIHRCVLRLLDAEDLAGLLDALDGEVTEILRVDRIRLVLESVDGPDPGASPHGCVAAVGPGFVDGYITLGRSMPARQVTLRPQSEVPEDGARAIFGPDSGRLASEALLRLDLGQGRRPAMLAIGSEDPGQFRANQGTELLTFLSGGLERLLRLHLR